MATWVCKVNMAGERGPNQTSRDENCTVWDKNILDWINGIVDIVIETMSKL